MRYTQVVCTVCEKAIEGKSITKHCGRKVTTISTGSVEETNLLRDRILETARITNEITQRKEKNNPSIL